MKMINEIVTRLMRSDAAKKRWPDEAERFKNVVLAARDILRGYNELGVFKGDCQCGDVGETVNEATTKPVEVSQ